MKLNTRMQEVPVGTDTITDKKKHIFGQLKQN